MSAFAADETQNHARRVEHLQAYMQNNPAGPFQKQAEDLMRRLDKEKAATARVSRQAQKSDRLGQEDRQRHRKTEAERLERELQSARSRLRSAAARFQDNGNGTVTDRKTGLEWTVLDAKQMRNRCLDHPQARAWAASLRTGGFNDWRLPKVGELSALYKSKPFFPLANAPWYWTSETHLKGFHETAEVVTTRQETVLRKKMIDQDKCGNARAVRP